MLRRQHPLQPKRPHAYAEREPPGDLQQRSGGWCGRQARRGSAGTIGGSGRSFKQTPIWINLRTDLPKQKTMLMT